MVKFTTHIEPRIKAPKKADRYTKVMIVVSNLMNLIIGTMIPFILGFYFAIDTNWWLLAIFIVWLLFDIRFEPKKDGGISIRIIRGI